MTFRTFFNIIVALVLLTPSSGSTQQTEPCAVSQQAFLDTHMTLYQAFKIDQARQSRNQFGKNARKPDMLDQLLGGLTEEAARATVIQYVELCPVTVQRIADGAGPFSNIGSLQEALMGALLLQKRQHREMASEMTSAEFRYWLHQHLRRYSSRPPYLP